MRQGMTTAFPATCGRTTVSGMSVPMLGITPDFSQSELGSKAAYIKVFGKDYYQYLSVSKNAYSSAYIRRLLQKTGFIVETVVLFDPILPVFIGRFSLGLLFIITARRP
jgi:hypothetical protein